MGCSMYRDTTAASPRRIRSLAGVLALVSLLSGSGWRAALAEEFQVVAFASLASTEEFTADLEALGGLVQNPNLGKALVRVLANRSGVQQLRGLDRTRNCGVAIITDGLRVAPLVLVPITDLERLLASLEPLIGPAVEQAESSRRVWKIGRGVVTGYVGEQAGWAYVAQTSDLLDDALTPQQIAQEFAQLPAGHDLAVRFYPLRLPEALRTFGIDMLREQTRSAADVDRDAGDESTAARQRLHRLALELFESSLSDQQQVTWSWHFDRKNKRARLDLEILPVADGALARHLVACKKRSGATLATSKSPLVQLNVALQLDAALAERMIEASRDLTLVRHDGDAAREPSDENVCIDSWQQLLVELAGPAFRRGEIGCHVVVSGAALPLTALVSLPTSESPSLEELLKQVGSTGDGAPCRAQINRNERQIAGRQVHRIDLPVADPASLVDGLFGDPPSCYLTATRQMWLLTCGPQGGDAMNEALEFAVPGGNKDLAQAMPPVTLSIRTGQAVELLSSLLGDRRQELLLSLISANLRSADDRVVLSIEPTPKALRARLVMHEGVLRAAAMGLNLAALQALSQPTAKPPQRAPDARSP